MWTFDLYFRAGARRIKTLPAMRAADQMCVTRHQLLSNHAPPSIKYARCRRLGYSGFQLRLPMLDPQIGPPPLPSWTTARNERQARTPADSSGLRTEVLEESVRSLTT